jgi:hypothetical protein
VESEDKIVPVAIGALGTIHRGSDLKLQLLPGHPSAIELQKITVMGTAHITSFGKGFELLLRYELTRRTPPSN